SLKKTAIEEPTIIHLIEIFIFYIKLCLFSKSIMILSMMDDFVQDLMLICYISFEPIIVVWTLMTREPQFWFNLIISMGYLMSPDVLLHEMARVLVGLETI
ncbi:hypothetical protein ACJX0J_032184, partial [Zea mays]